MSNGVCEELRFEAMQARFAAPNSGEPQKPFDPSFNPETMLHAEIGYAARAYRSALKLVDSPVVECQMSVQSATRQKIADWGSLLGCSAVQHSK